MGQDLTSLALTPLPAIYKFYLMVQSQKQFVEPFIRDLAIGADIIPDHCQDLELTQRNSKINFLFLFRFWLSLVLS